MTETQNMKEEGNQHFKAGDIEKALECYTKCLNTEDMKNADKAVIFKNLAACHLKLSEFEKAIENATNSLNLVPDDPKALYRRCQAYEKIGKFEDAYRDAGALIRVDPKNSAVQPILGRLNPIIQDRINQQNSTKSKVTKMFDVAFDKNGDKEKRIQAINNLIVLAREEAGSKIIVEMSGIKKLSTCLDEKDTSILQGSIRVLSCLCNENKERCWMVEKEIGVQKISTLMWMNSEEIATSAGNLIQTMLVHITGLDVFRRGVQHYHDERKAGNPCVWPKQILDDEQKEFRDKVFYMLIKMIHNHKVSGYGRDSAIEILIKNMNRMDGLQWTHKFLDTDGIEGLLTVAGAVRQHQTIPITDQSRMHASVALSKIYDDLRTEKESNKFRDKCSEYFKDLFGDDIFESKIEALKAIASLLQGPYEVGSMIMGFEGVTKLILALATTDNKVHQQVALECIVYAAQKKEKCMALLGEAAPILQDLYQTSKDDGVRVRALVGLCKLGSSAGSDASVKPLEEGSTQALAASCRRFLNTPSRDVDIRRWATDGLAFLTLDADVKEDLVNDTDALRSMIDVTAKAEKNILYPAVTVFVNLTNSYDKPDIMPELLELAKFAKHHIPEEHEKDKPEFVRARIHKLAKAGIVTALVSLSKTDSKNTREQLSRVFMAVATEIELRGVIVQQGGTKALLNLSKDNNTDKGYVAAAQALAKIAITMNPETSFPGQRMYEVVKPLVKHLLHMDSSALQNFEGLMALTNLASVSDSLRNRIVAEKGLAMIEHYMTEDHEMLKRAATECMCNMVMNEGVQKLYEGENDRTKLMTLYCGDEDPCVVKAASGAMAFLTHNPLVCKKVLEVKQWFEILQGLCVSESPDIQHRGCYIVRNLINSDKEVAEKVIGSQLMEVLMALTLLNEPERKAVKECAEEALELAKGHGLIKAKDKTDSILEED